ncbi:MAG: hypothetical protein NXI04_12155 [Planctomycetaceae bacterium]|nr:hypothetical protein [Planctomycetaceae bacterium]
MVSQSSPGRRARHLLDLNVRKFQQSAHLRWQTGVYSPVQMHQLSLTIGLDDRGLLRRLLDHNLRADNVLALKFAPIAEVAWASGQVTRPEYVMAIKPVFSAELFRSGPATDTFRTWLKVRPPAGLWSLWEDFARASASHYHQATNRAFGQRLYDLAAEVALASGGLVDEGGICRAERSVLDRIWSAYDLRSTDGRSAKRFRSTSWRNRDEVA